MLLGTQLGFGVQYRAELWGGQAAAPLRPGREAAGSNLLRQQRRQVCANTTCSQAPLAENVVCNIPLRGSGVEDSAPSSGSYPSIHRLEFPH